MSKFRAWALDIAVIVLGAAIFSLGVHFFISPNNIASGGVTGLAIIGEEFLKLGVGTWIFLLNIPLITLGFFLLNKATMLKTLISVSVITVFTDIAEAFVPVYETGGIVAAIFGGAAMGAGIGLTYRCEGTSGGADILTKIIGKYNPSTRLGAIQAALDGIVVTAGLAVYRDIDTMLLAVIAIFVQSVLIDKFVYSGQESRLLLIFSRKSERIVRKILDEQHGVTILKGEGAYTREKSDVLATAVRRGSYAKLKRLIKEIDPDAFVVTTNAEEVLGQGFEGTR